MSVTNFDFPTFGGGMHGRNWQAAQAAQSGALGASGLAYVGTGSSAYYAALAAYNATREPAKPIEDAGIRAGEIIAWRAWRVCKGYLRSMAMDAVWMPGQPMGGDPASAGVHAFKAGADALTYGVSGWGSEYFVVGRVALWGEVIEHEKGYRAEFGAVHSLDYFLPREEQIEKPKRRWPWQMRQPERDRLQELREIYLHP